jgi:galactokinase
MKQTETREILIEQTTQSFLDHYGEKPTHAVTAPGRLNVIGEHVDYNGGVVLPAAIERWFVGVFRTCEEGVVRIFDCKHQEQVELDPNGSLTAEKGSWLNYPKGVFAQFQKRGVQIPGFDLCIYSNIPSGGGLSSSAAFESLIATTVEVLTGVQLEPMEKALLCQKAEHEYAGVPCGIMDQAAVIMSKENFLLQLDCRDLSVCDVPFSDESFALMVIDSGVHHELANGEYKKRRDACEQAGKEMGVESLRDATVSQVQSFNFSDKIIQNRALHVVSEIERTFSLIKALKKRDFINVGNLIQESHHSLQYLFEVSCPELDFIVAVCNAQPTVYGSRMMGGGFGGSAIVLVEKANAQQVAEIVEIAYKEKFGLEASIFLTSPARGVQWEAL